MGREIKRVVAGFDWPLNKVWGGFLMPEILRSVPCPAGEACRNGQTAAGAWVMAMAHMMLMLDDDLGAQQRGQAMHPYFDHTSSIGYGCRPSPDIREFGTALAGREGGFLGHDAIDRWNAFGKIVAAIGLDEAWGRCPSCGGNAYVEAYPGQDADSEAWERTEPPTGEWWQVWETVSEGSPVSPAFETPEALASYVVLHPETRGPRNFVSAISQADALAWITGPGWAPSGIIRDGVMKTGVDSMIGSES